MRQELKVIAACLAAYAVFLPIALWLGSGYVPAPRPPGETIEQLLKITPAPGSAYQSQSRALWKHAGEGAVILYEDLTPLGPANFVKLGGNTLIFSASDNSDPRTNGRNYWLVLPQ